MLGEKFIGKQIDKFISISRTDIKSVKKIFKKMDRILKYREQLESETDEKEKELLEHCCESEISSIGIEFSYLANYEVSCEAFKKYVTDEKYLPLIDEAYEAGKGYIEKKESSFRLKETPCGSKRKAKKEMKEMLDRLKKADSIATKILFSKEANCENKKLLYGLRDWFINDFDALIDSIEPVRQEYIISRKGEVSVEEVDEMLLEKFPDVYEIYTSALLNRPQKAMSYYPGLKIE